MVSMCWVHGPICTDAASVLAVRPVSVSNVQDQNKHYRTVLNKLNPYAQYIIEMS